MITQQVHSIIIFGPLPPPRHGVSSVNDAVAKQLMSRGINPIIINTAPLSLERNLRVRFKRMFRVAMAIGKLMYCANRQRLVYFSLSGGYGLLYEAPGVLIARLRGAHVVVHHHSFRYLDAPFWPMKLLVCVAGSDTRHVTLCRMMAERLQQAYPLVRHVRILSNAGFVPDAACNHTYIGVPIKVGFLSNLSAEKGLDEFLALAEASAVRGLPWRFLMAGPYESVTNWDHYTQRISALPNLEYRGALYAEAKNAFLRDIDIFVFPTRYRNEAEPLVVLEALNHGKPVIAFGRGCIEELLGYSEGNIIQVGGDFVGLTLKLMEVWRVDDNEFRQHCIHARQRFDELQEESKRAFDNLLAEFNIKFT